MLSTLGGGTPNPIDAESMQNLIPTMVSQWVTVKNNSCQVKTLIGRHLTDHTGYVQHTHTVTYTPAFRAHALSDQKL